jgi:hypothetical protein
MDLIELRGIGGAQDPSLLKATSVVTRRGFLLHTLLCEHAHRLQLRRVLHEENQFLCSRLLNLYQSLAKRAWRSDQCPLAHVFGGNIAFVTTPRLEAGGARRMTLMCRPTP